MSDPLLVLDANLCVLNANFSFYDFFADDLDAMIGKPLYELGDVQWDIEELRLVLGQSCRRARR